jgi:uncharacterized protein (TIGR02271 family)
MSVTISKLFDDHATASRAVAELESAGVPRPDISMVASNADNWYSESGDRGPNTPATTRVDRDGDGVDDRAEGAGAGAGIGAAIGGTAGLLAGLGLMAIPGIGPVVAAGWLAATAAGAITGAAAGGIIGALTQAGVSEEDAQVYAEGVRRGGTLVTARVQDNDRARLQGILDRSGVDIARRREAYRQSGWRGFDESSQPYTPDQVRRERQQYGHAGQREGVIPVVEEELRVGKRDVHQGEVKVKSHVVETPVTEQVSLQQERVSVERRPVDRPLSGSERAFQDRTIEVEQKGQEAVVSKDARIKEEVVVNKDVQQRNQKVSDTVRRTEVEIEDERTRKPGPGSSRTANRR